MAYLNKKYEIKDLIKFGSSGIEKASFYQIKEALIEMYKNIYGHDIDVDSTTADGQFIYNIALLIDNTFNALLNLNNNLNPASASGKWLDVICGFNNIERKTQTASKAYCYLKCLRNYIPDKNQDVQQIQLIDTHNNTWTWIETKKSNGEFYTEKFEAGKWYTLLFTCDKLGPVIANPSDKVPSNTSNIELFTNDVKGDINRTISADLYPFEVWQKDINIGEYEETDNELRSRRLRESGYKGTTTLSSLMGALQAIDGIKDVKIYNSANSETGIDITANDGTIIKLHNIYIILRYADGINFSDQEIISTIYNKITPGIASTPYNEENDKYNTGESLSAAFKIYSVIQQDIYWKKCKPISPSFTLNFMYTYDYNAYDQEEYIKNGIKDYAYKLSLTDNLYISNIINTINGLTTQYVSGLSTYVGTTGKFIENKDDDHNHNDYYENRDTYFDYNNCTFEYTYTSQLSLSIPDVESEPSSDNIKLIESVNGNTLKSENLLVLEDVEETTINGVTYSIKNGVITLNGTSTALTQILKIDVNSNDILYFNAFASGTSTDSGGFYVEQENGITYNANKEYNGIKSIVFYTNGDGTYTNRVYKPMLVKGPSAPSDYTITINGIEVSTFKETPDIKDYKISISSYNTNTKILYLTIDFTAPKPSINKFNGFRNAKLLIEQR